VLFVQLLGSYITLFPLHLFFRPNFHFPPRIWENILISAVLRPSQYFIYGALPPFYTHGLQHSYLLSVHRKKYMNYYTHSRHVWNITKNVHFWLMFGPTPTPLAHRSWRSIESTKNIWPVSLLYEINTNTCTRAWLNGIREHNGIWTLIWICECSRRCSMPCTW
jgi:hypothetical protein